MQRSEIDMRELINNCTPTALYGAEAWGKKIAERRKVDVPEMKCLRGLVGVSLMDRVRNGEVRIYRIYVTNRILKKWNRKGVYD